LAHFANADIGRSYFSDALWKSIRWLLVLPFLFALTAILIEGFLRGIFDPSQLELAIAAIPDVLVLFIQWGVVLVVTGMIWARLLKTREFYADWRAALWGSQKGLQIIFQEEIEKARSKARIFFWRFHPDARERLDVLEHTDTLFKLSPAMILLAGLLLSLIFAGLTFSFAAFIVFAENILTLRDSTSGLFYWVLTGIWWSGFAVLILLVFGLTGWLVNNILLPQIQKQAVWELLHKQSGWVHYIRLGIPALILIIGIELGFFITPFSQLAPNDMVWFLIELFIILPVLASLAWWYLIYIKFIASRVSATEIGTSFSAGRRRFLGTASVVWVFLFFMPGLLLSRFIDLGFPYFLYFNISWLIFTLLFSPLVFGATLAAIKFFFDNPPKRCPHCGNITGHAAPAIELCEHCGGVLGEWLFVPESS
jgi:hypothetical protein